MSDHWTLPDFPAVAADSTHRDCIDLLERAHRVIRDVDGEARTTRILIKKYLDRLGKEPTDPGNKLSPRRNTP